MRKVGGNRGIRVFEMTGGRLCLDFANTVDRRGDARPQELLETYGDLLSWCRQAGVLSSREARRSLLRSARSPEKGGAWLKRVIVLREAIFRVFSAAAAGRRPPDSDLKTVSATLGRTLTTARLSPSGEGFLWRWSGDPASPDRVLWETARSAIDLLTSDDLGKVRECAAIYCRWLFMDGSRNQSRRWCDMKSCGNRAKARRHYERSKTGK